MIKSGLIARVSERYPHLGITEVEAVVNTILARIGTALAADDRVELLGLGVFSALSRAPRPGRNLSSGEMVQIGKKRIVSFKASHKIKTQLRQSVVPVTIRRTTLVVRLNLLPGRSPQRLHLVQSASPQLDRNLNGITVAMDT